MARRRAILIWLCIACAPVVFSPSPVHAQATTPAPETPGEQPKDRYVAEMANVLASFRGDMDRVDGRAVLEGKDERPLLVEARREFELSERELRQALAAVAAADPFTWEEQKPACDAAAASLEAAYRKALAALE